jgi:aldose 1-epimerase
MDISRTLFGTLGNGERVWLYRLAAGDLCLTVASLGATWVSLFAPDAAGRTEDVILGYRTLDGYTRNAANKGIIKTR